VHRRSGHQLAAWNKNLTDEECWFINGALFGGYRVG